MPAELLIPALVPGMIDRNDPHSARVDPGDVRAFVGITIAAGPSEVLGGGLPAMLLGDDVLKLKRQGAVSLRQVAVFATRPCVSTNRLPELFVHA